MKIQCDLLRNHQNLRHPRKQAFVILKLVYCDRELMIDSAGRIHPTIGEIDPSELTFLTCFRPIRQIIPVAIQSQNPFSTLLHLMLYGIEEGRVQHQGSITLRIMNIIILITIEQSSM
jgi:hypothetical protein